MLENVVWMPLKMYDAPVIVWCIWRYV